MELPEITLPTDNIYKTSFCLGLLIIVFSFIPFYYKHQVEIEKVRLSGEIEDLENRKMWIEEDGKRYQDEKAKLTELRKGKFEEMPRLDPNTEEYKKFLEATGQKEDPNNPTSAIFTIDIQEIKQAMEKKHKIVRETQEKLKKTKDELVNTTRNILVSEVQIKTKKKELLQTDKFIANLLRLGVLGIFIGIFSAGYGGYNWWTKTQKWQDRIKVKQASLKKEKDNA
jgi:hypothetical protein